MRKKTIIGTLFSLHSRAIKPKIKAKKERENLIATKFSKNISREACILYQTVVKSYVKVY